MMKLFPDDNGGMKKLGNFLGKESLNVVEQLLKYFIISGINQ